MKNIKILIIDDHAPIVEGYKSILKYYQEKYEVTSHTGHSISDGLKKIKQINQQYDLVMLDITLPPDANHKINSGDELIPYVREFQPQAKIMVLTSHTESLILHKIATEYQVEGILIKSDFHSDELAEAFIKVVEGATYFSETVRKYMTEWNSSSKVMDSYNRQILLLLAKGVKTKNMPEILHLSQSAIDKRKATIKVMLGLTKGNDEDILREAKKQGLL